jgi:hypothetical protein
MPVETGTPCWHLDRSTANAKCAFASAKCATSTETLGLMMIYLLDDVGLAAGA